MRVELHPLVLEELKRDARYYESCRRGLGRRFSECVYAAFDEIAESPSAWPVLEGDARRYLLRIFPYAVLYSLEQDCALVVAVMHCRRRPCYWRDRVHEADERN